MEERHLKILTSNEVDELYGLPALDELQREEYFYLHEPERLAMLSLRGLAAKVYFIIQLGYFKAKQQFYIFTFAQVPTDVVAVLRTHFAADYSPSLLNDLLHNVSTVSKPTRLTQQKMILELTGYQSATANIRKLILRKAQYLARIHSKPIYIFREIVHFLQHRRIVLPGYTVLQQHIISRALVLERERLEQLLSKYLSRQEVSLLQALIEKDNTDPLAGQPFYALTYLQQEPANLTTKRCEGNWNEKPCLSPYIISPFVFYPPWVSLTKIFTTTHRWLTTIPSISSSVFNVRSSIFTYCVLPLADGNRSMIYSLKLFATMSVTLRRVRKSTPKTR